MLVHTNELTPNKCSSGKQAIGLNDNAQRVEPGGLLLPLFSVANIPRLGICSNPQR